ncbi:MAG TPA: mechanosensitive ion channel family protein, partial [Myxococcota bacterium]|nr:mechanosensitive ion channel family protein [Myxococcota bacterium]
MIDTFTVTGNDWLDALLAAAAAVAVGLVAHAVFGAVIGRIARPHLAAHTLVEHSRAAARWVFAFVALQFAWEAAPADLPHLGAVKHATSLALIAAVTWLALRFVRAMNEVVAILNPMDTADNLRARALRTQARVLGRVFGTVVVLVGVASALITFPGIRQLGATLLASAGLNGIVAGFAARPVLGNLIAGLQIALT